MQKNKWLWLSVAVSGALGCSLVIGDWATENCRSDEDCSKLALSNPKFLGSKCVSTHCTTDPSPDAGPSDSGPAVLCTSNVECSEKYYAGRPAVCLREDDGSSKCAPLEDEKGFCKVNDRFANAARWKDDEAVVMAHLESLIISETADKRVYAGAMAFNEINTYGPGIPEYAGGPRPRPIVYVHCDYDNVEENLSGIVDHLYNAGVRGFIGPGNNELVIALSKYTVPKGMFFITSIAVTPAISDLPDNGLIWRISPSGLHDGLNLKAYLPEVEKRVRALYPPPAGIPAGEKLKIAVLVLDEATGSTPYNAFKENLTFNDGASTPTSAEFFYRSYPNPKLVAPNYIAISDELDNVIKPHIIINFGRAEFFYNTTGAIRTEQKWTETAYRPFWMINQESVRSRPTEMRNFANLRPDIRSRFIGSYARDVNQPVFDSFLQAYDKAYSLTYPAWEPDTQYVYDAAYVLTYAYYGGAPNKRRPTGEDIRYGATRLVPTGPATKIPVGLGPQSNAITSAFAALRTNALIDLEGATNNLNFDTQKGEIPVGQATMAIMCYGTCQGQAQIPPCPSAAVDGGTVYYKESGQAYDPIGNKITGTYSCP